MSRIRSDGLEILGPETDPDGQAKQLRLLSNHLNLPAPARARLLVLMGNLAEIEQWRLTLTPTQYSGCG
jgi:hypothetical protein